MIHTKHQVTTTIENKYNKGWFISIQFENIFGLRFFLSSANVAGCFISFHVPLKIAKRRHEIVILFITPADFYSHYGISNKNFMKWGVGNISRWKTRYFEQAL